MYFVKPDLRSHHNSPEEILLSAKQKHLTPISPCFSEGFLINGKPAKDDDIYISSIYTSNQINWIIVLPQITIRLIEGGEIGTIIHKYGKVLLLDRQECNRYYFHCNLTSSEEVLNLAKDLYSEKSVVWSEPVCLSSWNVNNPKYSTQYYLKNSGQTGGTSGIDINVEYAWNITNGSNDITVAVIDEGVDNNHEDLSNCVLSGYTVGNNSGYGVPQNSNSLNTKSHGVACAGIICAEDNSIGIKGVAPGIKMLPVNIVPNIAHYEQDTFGFEYIDYGFANSIEIAAAIRWAYPRADVLSCSWGGGVSCSEIADAIQEARTLGRNGKGTPVVVSTGNSGANSLSFPSSVNGVISVGGIDKNGQRCSYSQYGTGLDLVAIGGNSDIVTTDRMGALGYTTSGDWNYFDSFDGTSAACPQVAGIIALMLSANPYQTEAQIKEALFSTCKKLSGYTFNNSGWNNEVGYGLVDAGAAVESCAIQISGPTVPCGLTSYTVVNLPDSCSVQWAWKYSSDVDLLDDFLNEHTCLLSVSNKKYYQNTLIATVYRNGNVIRTIEKDINTAPGFSGYYKQDAVQVGNFYNPPVGQTPFQIGQWLAVSRGSTITITSSKFIGATITYTGATPLSWSHIGDKILCSYTFFPVLNSSGNIISSLPPNNSTEVTVVNPSTCERFYFYISPINSPTIIDPLFSPQLSLSQAGQDLTLSLVYPIETIDLLNSQTDTDHIAWELLPHEWLLNITNAYTGKQVFKGTIIGKAHTVSTSQWEEGFYIVHAVIGDSSTTYKIFVNNNHKHH